MELELERNSIAMSHDRSACRGPHGFSRTLGFGSLLGVAVGLVVSQGVMVIMLQGVGFAGGHFFVAIAIGYILAITYVLSFSELCLMFKRAGTLSTYTEVALGHFPAIVAVFCGYIVVAMFALSAELVIIDLLLGSLFPGAIPPLIVAFGTLVFLTLMNIRGVDIFVKIQSVLAVTMSAALLIMGGTAILGLGAPRPLELSLMNDVDPIGWGVLTLIALAIWGFVGAEFVCPLVEETKEPEKNIPRAMLIGVTIIMVIYVVYCLGALYYVPRQTLLDSALPHVEYVKAVFGETGLIFLTIAAVNGHMQYRQYDPRCRAANDLWHGPQRSDVRGVQEAASQIRFTLGVHHICRIADGVTDTHLWQQLRCDSVIAHWRGDCLAFRIHHCPPRCYRVEMACA